MTPPPIDMGASTGGDGGASGGGIQQCLTGQPPHTNTSIPAVTGPTLSRLQALFAECVDNGVWASLETVKKRGSVRVEFFCSITTAVLPANAGNRGKVFVCREILIVVVVGIKS